MEQTKTHWKKLRNNDYLGAWILEPGQDMILTIKKVERGIVATADGKKEDESVMYFQEDVKPLVLNVTNSKQIAKLYDSNYVEDWEGKSIQIYSAKVRAFKETVDAIRIRDFKPCECADCHKEIKPFQNMNSKQLSLYTQKNYKRPLCAECAQKAAEKK